MVEQSTIGGADSGTTTGGDCKWGGSADSTTGADMGLVGISIGCEFGTPASKSGLVPNRLVLADVAENDSDRPSASGDGLVGLTVARFITIELLYAIASAIVPGRDWLAGHQQRVERNLVGHQVEAQLGQQTARLAVGDGGQLPTAGHVPGVSFVARTEMTLFGRIGPGRKMAAGMMVWATVGGGGGALRIGRQRGKDRNRPTRFRGDKHQPFSGNVTILGHTARHVVVWSVAARWLLWWQLLLSARRHTVAVVRRDRRTPIRSKRCGPNALVVTATTELGSYRNR